MMQLPLNRFSPRRRLGLPAAITALTALALAPTSEAAEPRFSESPLPLNTFLFDASAADTDGDGDLELFATSHKYRGNLLSYNAADGSFVDSLDQAGLSSTADIPGFDDLGATPTIGAAGFYMWVDKNGFTHLRSHNLGTVPQIPGTTVSGELQFPARPPIDVKTARGAEVKLSQQANQGAPATRIVNFNLGPNAEVKLRAAAMDLPFRASVDPAFPRARILLGPRLSPPPAHTFDFDLGDRHGVIWADLNQDGQTDAYIANGGNRGNVPQFGELAEDEIYSGLPGGGFREEIDSYKITKGFCRGRYAAPVDYDIDGDLDIFVGCEGKRPLLLRQNARGQFGSQSDLLSAAGLQEADQFKWADVWGDTRPELIAVKRRKVRVYRYDGKNERFSKLQGLKRPKAGVTTGAMALGDLDGDLDLDVFVPSRTGNTVLLNTGKRFRAVNPGRFGLPERGTTTGAFVDFDNDGLLDFHALPQGLYRAAKPGRFRQTGALGDRRKAQWGVANWADFDGDGDRDLAFALRLPERGAKSGRSRLASEEKIVGPLASGFNLNQTQGGHWLNIDLVGPAANRQAIGARVVITADGRKQAGWVGQSEGSRYSSGHHRLYFGLGDSNTVDEVRVIWPDGATTTRSNVAADQRIEIGPG